MGVDCIINNFGFQDQLDNIDFSILLNVEDNSKEYIGDKEKLEKKLEKKVIEKEAQIEIKKELEKFKSKKKDEALTDKVKMKSKGKLKDKTKEITDKLKKLNKKFEKDWKKYLNKDRYDNKLEYTTKTVDYGELFNYLGKLKTYTSYANGEGIIYNNLWNFTPQEDFFHPTLDDASERELLRALKLNVFIGNYNYNLSNWGVYVNPILLNMYSAAKAKTNSVMWDFVSIF